MSAEEQEYVTRLKLLVLIININPADLQIQVVLFETQARCPSDAERVLLNKLVDNITEYRYLSQNMKGVNYTDDEHEKYFSLVRWFNNLNFYLNKFNTLLCLLPQMPE